MKKLLSKIFTCWLFNFHDWTSKAIEGVPPDPIKEGESAELAFWEYAKMYCKCCGKVSPLSQKEIDRVKDKYTQCPTCKGKGVLPEGCYFTRFEENGTYGYKGNKEGDKCNICSGSGTIVSLAWKIKNEPLYHGLFNEKNN